MHQDFPQNLNWVASLNYSKSLKQFSNELKVSNPISWNSWLWLVFSEKMSMKTVKFYSFAALDKGKIPGLNKILKLAWLAGQLSKRRKLSRKSSDLTSALYEGNSRKENVLSAWATIFRLKFTSKNGVFLQRCLLIFQLIYFGRFPLITLYISCPFVTFSLFVNEKHTWLFKKLITFYSLSGFLMASIKIEKKEEKKTIVSDITDICLAIEMGIFISHLRIALYEKLNSQTVIFNLFSPPMATRNKQFFFCLNAARNY